MRGVVRHVFRSVIICPLSSLPSDFLSLLCLGVSVSAFLPFFSRNLLRLLCLFFSLLITVSRFPLVV